MVASHSRLAAIEGPVTRGDLPAHRRAEPTEIYTLTVWDLSREYARTIKRIELRVPKADALEVLAAMRDGLPSNCGASLKDLAGRNVR
jgi:hypothetical protein